MTSTARCSPFLATISLTCDFTYYGSTISDSTSYDYTSQVLTYSANDKTYRVWDMTNYDELYRLPEGEITEIKISPGIMLLILSRRDGHIPLKVTSPNPEP